MKAGQFSTADAHKDYDDDLDFGAKTRKPNRRWLLYGIGLIALFVICVISIFTCKIPMIRSLLPICKPPVAPPTITKSFSPDSIKVNEVSTLTFTFGNSNSVALTGVSFTDALPSGLQVADLPSATTDCGGEPAWAPSPGTTSLIFGSPTGGTIPANGSCSVSVNIKGTVRGQYQNVSGSISSANGGVNTSSTGKATASIAVTDSSSPDGSSVVQPPNMAELFVPDQISSTNTSTLTFAITNPNTSKTLTGVTFSNTYPDGLTNATPLNTTNTCGGTLTADAGGNGVSLSDGTIPVTSNCTVTVDVTAVNDGSYENTSVVLSSTNGGAGIVAPDTLYVGIVPPEISIHFLKEVSASAEGPWSKFISVSSGTNVYYRFTIENLGNTPFYQFYVTDPAVSTEGCSGDLSEVSSGENIKICVTKPIAAESGTHVNTATASGTYANKPYTTAPSTATYVTIPQTNLDLYLPDTLQKFGSHFQEQVDIFKRDNVGVTINIAYYSESQSQSDSATGLFVLTSPDVINFAERGLLQPVSTPSELILEDARESVTANERVFAYPWQREICSSNYLNLAISAQLPSDVAAVANNLSAFLTNEANQRSNFEKWQIYPTLKGFYRSEPPFLPEVSCSAVDQQATDHAEELVNVLVEKFGVSVEPSLAKGLDAATVGGVPGESVGTITPVIDGNQKYKHLEVKGTFSITSSGFNNNLFDLTASALINKGALEHLLLPAGNYVLACTSILGDKDCLAVSIEQGTEFEIDKRVLFDEDSSILANVPFARYEQGSKKKCFYVLKRKVCIRVFKD